MLSERNYRALLEYRTEKETGPKMTDQIRYFKDCGYIRAGRYDLQERPGEFYINPTAWIITPRGEDALAEFEQVVKNHSEEKSNQKKSRIFEIFLVLLGAVIGYLIDHISNIISWIVSLF